MLRNALIGLILLSLPIRVCATEQLRDVPKDHWAAGSVKTLADAGIVKGYPDGKFKGDKPVTRYELAVALDGMIRFIRASFEPVKTTDSGVRSKDWANNSVSSLKSGGFLPPDSPLLKDSEKTVTADELAEALAVVAAKLIEERVPAADQNPAENP